jgi:hypothetical protein
VGDFAVGYNHALDERDKAFARAMYPLQAAPPPEPEPVWKRRGYWYEGRGRNLFVKTPASNEFGTGSYARFGWQENTGMDSDDLIFHQPKTQAARRPD